MTLDEYQTEVRRTMEGGEGKGDMRLAIFGLGLAGEAGEVVDLLKKGSRVIGVLRRRARAAQG